MEAGALISELKRRRVFRALVGYGIAAFAVLQIIEPIMHGLHWPDEVLSYVVVALAVGFPIVVSLAWIFDVKAGRIERTAPASAAPKGLRLGLVLVGIGVLAAAPGVVWYFVARSPARPVTSSAGAPEARPSIAVLPFADMSPGKDQEYFSDGIAEEILNALAQVEGLKVVGRTSSFSFKGKGEDLRTIGEKLGVAHVLEGCVRKEGGHIRITAQLIAAVDGSHIWSNSYDREMTGVFAVQDEIAKAVVAALKITLLPGKSVQATQSTSPEAYTLYLTTQQLWWAGGDPATVLTVGERVVAADPHYAPGWASLALLLSSQDASRESAVQTAARRRRAIEAAEKAVANDPSLALAYAARGRMRNVYGWDWLGAKADLERSLATAPGDARANKFYGGILATLGHLDEGIQLMIHATELDPLLYTNWEWLGFTDLNAGKFALARAAFQREIELAPGRDEAPIEGIAASYLLEGRLDLADQWTEKARDDSFKLAMKSALAHARGAKTDARSSLTRLMDRIGSQSPMEIAQESAWQGDADQAFYWLEKAYTTHDDGMEFVKVDAWLRSLHGDPRWTALLKKMNLPVD